MQRIPRRILIPVTAIGVVLICLLILLLLQQGELACGARTLTHDSLVTLEDGTRLALQLGENYLRFDSRILTEADLKQEANAQALAAVNAMPVNLVVRGSILAFSRCIGIRKPIYLESAAPDPRFDAYAWDGARWNWLGGSTDKLAVNLPDLPQYVVWAEALPAAPAIGIESTDGLAAEYEGVITEVYAPGLKVAANGSVTGPVPAAPAAGSPYAIYPIVSNVAADGSIDSASAQAMLKDVTARQAHIDTLVSIATGSNFAGIAIDYRDLGDAAPEAFTVLVDDLAAALHAAGKQLVVRLPVPDLSSTTPYDWVNVGRAADVVQMELPLAPSDYQTGGVALSIVEWTTRWVDRGKVQPVISAASSRGGPISFAEAAQAFFPSASAPISATAGTSLTLSLGTPDGVRFDSALGSYSTGLTGDETSLHTAATLAQKIEALADFRLRGVVIQAAHGQDAAPDLLTPIKAYRQQMAVSGSGTLDVVWSIAAASGSTLPGETRSLANADWTWLPDREGTFTVTAAIGPISRNVAIVAVGEGAGRPIGEGNDTDSNGDVTDSPCFGAVYVADVTIPDNTRFDKGKDFVKTWRVRNNGACAWEADTELAFVSGAQLGAASPVKVGALDVGKTIDVSVPMKSGDKDGSFSGAWQLRSQGAAFGDQLTVVIKVGAEVAAPPIVPPVGGGPTQYGVHAHFYGYLDTEAGAQNIANYATELGVGWVKIQFRWGDYDYFCGGADLNVLNAMVNRANASGLKVMLSVVTAPPCTHSWTDDVHAPPDDANALGDELGGLADFFRGRVHAIEVWNEQNISREWTTSPQKIDAARYTQMLAAAYNAVKSKDPNILVISGALAPTGWNDGVNAVDDFEYLKQMVAAGATKYMDCVGVHVNALRVPPSAGLGGEYDSLFSPPHHSWYFKDTLLGYQSITGKPACVTEFGVATQEGVGTVAGFEWAADNTQQEQADWVAEGMSLCRQWGCRLMILWNLDYGPATGVVNDNALYSFLDMSWQKRPVFSSVKNWCATNGCR